MERLLQELDSSNPSNQIKIIESSKANIASIEGEILTYSATYGPRDHFLIYFFFDYKEFIWVLNVDAIGNISNQAKSEFDHIVKSFEFLQ
jgi:hypothetical protein